MAVQVRRIMAESGALSTQMRGTDEQPWRSADTDVLGYEPPFASTWEAEQARRSGVVAEGAALPFCPLSFRDVMLYEEHYIGAARGHTRRFQPRVAAFARRVERATGRTFPPFRPPKLWYRQPIYYMSNAQTIVPSGTAVPIPHYTMALDWELELGFVLKAPLLDASPDQAERAIGAFVVLTISAPATCRSRSRTAASARRRRNTSAARSPTPP